MRWRVLLAEDAASATGSKQPGHPAESSEATERERGRAEVFKASTISLLEKLKY